MPRRFTITIDIEGDAFHPWPDAEVAAILEDAAVRIRRNQFEGRAPEGFNVRDSNGNTVGRADWEGDPMTVLQFPTRAAVAPETVTAPEIPTINTTGKAYETTTPSGRPLKPISIGPKDTAVIIRRVLKSAYPDIKFSVTTGRGSGVSSVDIRWQDGPLVSEVEALVGWPFEAGSFDGMTDSFTYAKNRRVIVDGVLYEPCTRYVSLARVISPAMANRCIARVAAYWGGIDVVPRAVPSKWGTGYELTPELSNTPIRDDDHGWQHHMTWSSQIHQCAGDPGKFVRELEWIDTEAEYRAFAMSPDPDAPPRCEACDPENMGYACDCATTLEALAGSDAATIPTA
jgi:hypothetical protein